MMRCDWFVGFRTQHLGAVSGLRTCAGGGTTGTKEEGIGTYPYGEYVRTAPVDNLEARGRVLSTAMMRTDPQPCAFLRTPGPGAGTDC